MYKKGSVPSLGLLSFGERRALALADITRALDFANDQIDTGIDLWLGHAPDFI